MFGSGTSAIDFLRTPVVCELLSLLLQALILEQLSYSFSKLFFLQNKNINTKSTALEQHLLSCLSNVPCPFSISFIGQRTLP